MALLAMGVYSQIVSRDINPLPLSEHFSHYQYSRTFHLAICRCRLLKAFLGWDQTLRYLIVFQKIAFYIPIPLVY